MLTRVEKMNGSWSCHCRLVYKNICLDLISHISVAVFNILPYSTATTATVYIIRQRSLTTFLHHAL